jgi:hypothetical protein
VYFRRKYFFPNLKDKNDPFRFLTKEGEVNAPQEEEKRFG